MLEALSPYILKVHITTILLLVPLLLWTDALAFRWVRGKIDVLDRVTLTRIHRTVSVGLSFMVTSGFLLFYPYQEYLLYETTFRVKMFFVFTLVVNSFFIGRLLRTAVEHPFVSLPQKTKTSLLVSGIASSISWVGAISMGLLLNL